MRHFRGQLLVSPRRINLKLIFSVAVFAIGIASAFFVFFYVPKLALNSPVSFSRLQTCLENPDTVILCAREEALKLLNGRSGKDAMTLLAEALPAGKCHTIGHIVGQEVYKRAGNIEMAIAECGYGCTGSCVHGVIGQALITELGLDEREVDPKHLDVDYVAAAGEKLCAKRSTCHAVGHVLFQIYNEFEKPLALCKNISKNGAREHCFRGVFMEQADTVSTHNLLLGTERKQLRDPENLRFPCDSVASEYQHACLRYLSRIHEPIFEEKNFLATEIDKKEREVCESFADASARSSCFEGYGFANYELVRTKPDTAHRVCDELQAVSDRTACVLGIVYAVADFGDISRSLNFCREVSGEAEMSVCYHGVFEAAKLRVSPHLSPEQIRMLCASADLECLSQAKNYINDPWDTVFGIQM